MQGAYLLRDRVTEATVELHNRFRELCTQVGDSLSPMTLREQANRIADALRTDLTAFLEGLPAADVAAIYSSSPVVARVAVSGFGNRGPESVVVGLGVAIDRPTNRWEVQVQPLSRLTFSDCGVRFHGQESVVTILRTDKGVRIPKAELQQADVARLAELLRGSCSEASVQSASGMFVHAVRLTVMLGSGFGVPKGAVGPPIDLVVIPREGPIQVTRMTSW
jgi:hypothetical protein